MTPNQSPAEALAADSFEYWPAKRVMSVVGYSRVTLWRKSRDPDDDFPAPYQLSPGKIAWRSYEIKLWQRRRPRVAYAPGRPASEAAAGPTPFPIAQTLESRHQGDTREFWLMATEGLPPARAKKVLLEARGFGFLSDQDTTVFINALGLGEE